MDWQYVADISIGQDWILTPELSDGLFRINHFPVENSKNNYLKAVIAPAFLEENISIYEPKRLTYREESELLYFTFPPLVHPNKLGLKRLDTTDLTWTIGIEFMPLYSTLTLTKKSLKEDSKTTALTSQGIEIVALNLNRRSLSVFNDTNGVITLGLGLATNQVTKVLARVPAGSVYELPVCGDGSLYCGAINASASKSGTIYTNEFSEDVT